MPRMALINYIKDLYENEELSLCEIARKTGHSFEIVRKYAERTDWNEEVRPNSGPQNYPVLGTYIPIIDESLEGDCKVPRKQRHTSKRMTA